MRTAQDYAELRARMLAQRRLERVERSEAMGFTFRPRLLRKKEGYAFVAMDRYLYHQGRAIELERRTTALFGCRTSWPLIEQASIYYNVEEKA